MTQIAQAHCWVMGSWTSCVIATHHSLHSSRSLRTRRPTRATHGTARGARASWWSRSSCARFSSQTRRRVAQSSSWIRIAINFGKHSMFRWISRFFLSLVTFFLSLYPSSHSLSSTWYNTDLLQERELKYGVLQEVEKALQLFKEIAIFTNRWKYAITPLTTY